MPPRCPHGDDQVAHLAAADGVEVGRGLVEDQQLGLVQERLGQRQALGHAFGELAGLAPGDRLQLRRGELALDRGGQHGAGHAAQGAAELEDLTGVEIARKARFLG